MTEREALKLALEALETGLCYVENEDFDNKQKFRGYEHLMPTDAAESIQEIKTVITAIKEALAQLEQEPVAWMRDDEMKAMVSDEKRAWILCGRSELIEEYNKPLYTTPPQRKPLTDAQLEKGRGQTFSINNPFCPCDSKTFRKVARWVEAAHDIKG